MNGGFKDIYSDDIQTNNYLKLFENEITKIQNYFYINNRIYLDIDYNYKGKNLSRLNFKYRESDITNYDKLFC